MQTNVSIDLKQSVFRLLFCEGWIMSSIFPFQFLFVSQNCDLKILSSSHDSYPFWELNKCFLSTTDRRRARLASCHFECFKGALVMAVLLLALVGVGGADLYCRQEQQTQRWHPLVWGLGHYVCTEEVQVAAELWLCNSLRGSGDMGCFTLGLSRGNVTVLWARRSMPGQKLPPAATPWHARRSRAGCLLEGGCFPTRRRR